MEKRLYRSRRNKIFAGVCGGIAEYFDIDPTIIRLIFIVGLFSNGVGILAYLITLIIVPLPPEEAADHGEANGEETEVKKTSIQRVSEKKRYILGGILIFIGTAFFAEKYFRWFDFDYLWPVLLVIIGCLIIFEGRKSKKG